MSEIEKIIESSKWGPFAGNDLNRVKNIIISYENIWQSHSQLWNVYKSRIASVQGLFVRKGDSKDTFTKTDSQKIFIYSPNPVPDDISPTAQYCDDVDYNCPELGHGDGHHDIAAAILMEMGNCKINPQALPDIRRKFYDGLISLSAVGIKIAGAEGAGMWDYIKMMREIPAAQRPYQSNRDVYKTRNVQTDIKFAEFFADTKHAKSTELGSTSLLSGECYSLETITDADYNNVLAATKNIGVKLLGLSKPNGENAWGKIVDLLKTKIGTNKVNNVGLYLNAIELIKKIAGTRIVTATPPKWNEWSFSVPMINASKNKSMCNVQLKELKPLINNLEQSMTLPPKPTLSDIEIKQLSGTYLHVI